MDNKRFRLVDVCNIDEIPREFLNIYKFINVYQSEMSADGFFSVEDLSLLLFDYHKIIKDFIQYGINNSFIQDGENPLSKLSVKLK